MHFITSIYELGVKAALRNIEREGPANNEGAIQALVNFAMKYPTGFYADFRLEQHLLAYSKTLFKEKDNVAQVESVKFLHVGTTLLGVGGHSRVLMNWIDHDAGRTHELVLTNQQEPIPEFIAEVLERNQVKVHCIPADLSTAEKAQTLYEIYAAGCDQVILHHHPNDLVPILAFGHLRERNITCYNHADHLFWVGASIVERTIEYMELGAAYSQKYRGIQQTDVIEFPPDLSYVGLTDRSLKNRLKIPEEHTVAVAIVSPYKLRPTSSVNFFETVDKMLREIAALTVILVGVGEDDFAEMTDLSRHERLLLPGRVEDVTGFVAIADLYLESYPMSGGLALIDACRAGVVPVFNDRAHARFTMKNICRFSFEQDTSTEQKYIKRVRDLVEDKALLSDLQQTVLQRMGQNTVEHWQDTINQILTKPSVQSSGNKSFENQTDQGELLDFQQQMATATDDKVIHIFCNARKSFALTRGDRRRLSMLFILNRISSGSLSGFRTFWNS